MYKIISNRKIWLSFSGLLVATAIAFLSLWGLNFGLDFTGGSLLEVQFNNFETNTLEIKEQVSSLNLSSLSVQPTENNSYILKFKDDNENIHKEIMNSLSTLAGDNLEASVEELRFDSVGPSIGEELKSKSLNAVILVLIIIVLYIALVFKKVSKPVSSWKYGITAIIALFHDVLITLGVFALLGYLMNLEINTPFVAAILTVIGYSVNDTIIVFDRIRENLPQSNDNFSNTVNKSVNQTITRSINTSLTTLLVLIAILIWGGANIQEFILALAIGIFIGTYSSIFLASPLLVVWEKLGKKK
ncbi:MAG: protein translocase subunit SecF [Candidatus Pacebacteria bacterium]|nr:protein translocase subunit SecF [Candidatus Paceibacterota bacterium]